MLFNFRLLSYNKNLLFLVIALSYTLANAQQSKHRIKLKSFDDINQYVHYLLKSDNIRISNVKYRGRNTSISTFEVDTNVFGFQKGLVLSTGEVSSITGQNKTPGTSGLAWDNNYRFKSDRDLNQLAKGKVSDQVLLEFDFIPLENQLTFRYFFASEEYKEYVGSRFNDVFGFIVTGENNFRKNIATIGELNLPVTINNINHVKNSHLFINNNCFENFNVKKEIDEMEPRKPFFKNIIDKLFGAKNKDFVVNLEEKKKLVPFLYNEFEFDGLTVPLEASIFLQPYKVYHMKIALGDVGDPMFDSGVFIESGSMTATKNRNAPGFVEYQDMRDKIDFEALFKQKKENPIKVDSPPQIPDEFEITNINFDVNKDVVHDTDDIKIRSLALFLTKNKSYRVHLLGYTDSKGSLEHNQKLSERRSIAVKNILLKHGVDESRINYVGNNYENPLDTNETERGRMKNRRVEVVVLE